MHLRSAGIRFDEIYCRAMPKTSVPSEHPDCPRCGQPVPYSGRGRRRIWCSDSCRQQAYAAREAAKMDERPIEVVVRERWHEPPPPEKVYVPEFVPHVLTTDECIEFILASPTSSYRMLRAMESRLSWGHWEHPMWDRVRRYFPTAAQYGRERRRR